MADSTDKKHKDSPEEMHSAHAWLERVAEELDLPQDVVRASIRDILGLTSAVAHNRSRPAAPVTAFLVGLAAGQVAGQAAEQSSENTSTDNLSASFTPLIERITNLAQD